MAGVTCVIGEHARNNEPNLKIDNGKVDRFPLAGKGPRLFSPIRPGLWADCAAMQCG